MRYKLLPIYILSFFWGMQFGQAQTFYFGNDLSYVNEMEDCGANFQEDNQPKDPYQIFADYGANLTRLRLWHTPSWYDNLNSGQRYSDLADVKKSIARAKAQGMEVMLDFHLSDTWADPGAQLIPAAWADKVDDLPILKDSLYNYLFGTLENLHKEDLLPEIIQIGNETNRGILLDVVVNSMGWTLDWDRNIALFNEGIKAVRDFERVYDESIEIMLHFADPKASIWFLEEFVKRGVTDFDLLGMSYYWNWHQPTTNQGTGEIIKSLKADYPQYEYMVVETAYPWTSAWQDNANNIAGGLHPDYDPTSPTRQKEWLIDLTTEVMKAGGIGVVYWEPAWVSTNCSTQWATGSSFEHATFFDFNHNLLPNGGISWMSHDYNITTSTQGPNRVSEFNIYQSDAHLVVKISEWEDPSLFRLFDIWGNLIFNQNLTADINRIQALDMPTGVYLGVLVDYQGRLMGTKKVFWGN